MTLPTRCWTRWNGLRLNLLACWLLGTLPGLVWSAENPDSLDAVAPAIVIERDGIEFSLVAEHPDVVTPTGIDVDEQGAVWVIANHTHFRPDDYRGPEHDQVLVFHPDGRRSVFYDKTDSSMDLELGSDGWVYVAQRDRVLRIRDSDDDGRGDMEETIVSLDTEADYPHNGLSGLTWSNDGDLIFALGENFAKPWTLTGSDGTAVRGSGEGGIFVCDARGGSLRRIAQGFWNPFGVCIRPDGSMFAAENDPGSRPPCRLLHLVHGGDYGYQRRYGNAAYHPFVCWNGELRGTLPMLHAVGEAPCGIAPLGNGLIVPSWTEHRIDFYPLRRDGASFQTERLTLIRGGDHFRPTCIAAQSGTTFYLTDWVFGSYELHGKGRIWRLTIDPQAADWLGEMSLEPANEAATLAESLRTGKAERSVDDLLKLCRDRDPFLRSAAIDALAMHVGKSGRQNLEASGRQDLDGEDLVSLLLAERKADPQDEAAAEFFFDHPSPDVQFEAMRWIADSEMTSFLPRVRQKLADPNLDYRLFEAALATSNVLSGTPELGVSDPKMLMSLLQDPETSPRLRAFALRLLDPQHPRFGTKLWHELLQVGDPDVSTELVRSVATVGSQAAREFLLEIVTKEELPLSIRADALSGLAGPSDASLPTLIAIAESEEPSIRDEALRSLRFAALSESDVQRLQRIGTQYPESADLIEAAIDPASLKQSRPAPVDLETWRRRLADVSQEVDLEAGRRLFHHSSVGTCIKCHRHSGRGSDLGPDLSAISSVGDPDRLLRALLQPSHDVDPQYHPRMLVTEDGRVFTGILLRDGGGGNEFYRDNLGREQMFKTDEIVQRKELSTSMMPDGLFELMTDREIRDLLAFIDNARETSLVAATTSPWVGSWWLDFDDAYGGWLELKQEGGEYRADLLWRVGSARPIEIASISDHELVLQRNRQNQLSQYRATMEGETIRIELVGSDEKASGGRCPPMPPRPDLTKVQFADRIDLVQRS